MNLEWVTRKVLCVCLLYYVVIIIIIIQIKTKIIKSLSIYYDILVHNHSLNRQLANYIIDSKLRKYF